MTKRLEDGLEVGSFVAGEGSGNIFPNSESWIYSMGCFPHFCNDTDGFKEKVRTLAFVDAELFAGDGQILAIMNGDVLDAETVIFGYGKVIHGGFAV